MLPDVDLRDDFLRLRLDDRTFDFHFIWLRHNCGCCRHPQTGERTLCSSAIAADIAPIDAALNGAGLHLTWPDGHSSDFTLDWLRQHAYALDRVDVPPPGSDVEALAVDANDAHLAARCLERVAAHGAAVVRGFGDDTEAMIGRFETLGLRVIETHFGRIEDLRIDNTTNRNTDQLGYTDAPVDLHTDQPFIEHPPRYQVLHCMRPAADGGDSYLADAFQSARHLRSVDRGAYDLLTRVPIRFLRQQKAFASLMVRPLLTAHGDDIVQVRSSYFTMAPHQVPFALMAAWYRAYNRFAALVADPHHQYRFRLAAGDFLLYDNFRMLHARTGFSGERWLRGVYFDR